ncbi:MAG TPA: 1,2-phenylacetyl-CoA epoxidase subunit PaaD [Burkholderiales bacterium]|nr:1,2-phenylacetyl-CoA epoxidase subunit PaaD [Burkholderiales bacterium]
MVDAWRILAGITDPEIPVISITELGIVREVTQAANALEVAITPTYSGCPAMHVIEQEIVERLTQAGYAEVRVRTVLAPAWSTDWIAPAARDKLTAYGIAPPGRVNLYPRSVTCPRCGAARTERVSEFGSTACKAHYRCLECLEPFDYFKPL